MASLYRSLKCVSSCSRLLSSHSKISLLQQSRRSLPICTIDTNLASANLPRDIHYEFEELMAKVLNKPISSCSVTVVPDAKISRDGDDRACVHVQIWSMDVFDEERNFDYTKQFYDYLLPKFGNIPYDRIVMLFHPLKQHNAGHLLYEQYQSNKLMANRAQ